jgi:hypothetical protein
VRKILKFVLKKSNDYGAIDGGVSPSIKTILLFLALFHIVFGFSKTLITVGFKIDSDEPPSSPPLWLCWQ